MSGPCKVRICASHGFALASRPLSSDTARLPPRVGVPSLHGLLLSAPLDRPGPPPPTARPPASESGGPLASRRLLSAPLDRPGPPLASRRLLSGPPRPTRATAADRSRACLRERGSPRFTAASKRPPRPTRASPRFTAAFKRPPSTDKGHRRRPLASLPPRAGVPSLHGLLLSAPHDRPATAADRSPACLRERGSPRFTAASKRPPSTDQGHRRRPLASLPPRAGVPSLHGLLLSAPIDRPGPPPPTARPPASESGDPLASRRLLSAPSTDQVLPSLHGGF